MIDPQLLSYPPPPSPEDTGTGLFPVDFLIEDVIRLGLTWFKTDPTAADKVFSHLKTSWLGPKYGQNKINEIKNYLAKFEVHIVQHFSMIGEQMPSISIQLLDGREMTDRAGLNDHAEMADQLNAQNEVIGRTQVKYSPITDSVHIGIHSGTTPDLCKYLYYLVMYSLLKYKPELEKRGLHLSTFQATDLSRINEYLPANIYSRFINFSVFSLAKIGGEDLPIVDSILGVHAHPSEDVEDAGIDIAQMGEE